jgi:hypothetical protein
MRTSSTSGFCARHALDHALFMEEEKEEEKKKKKKKKKEKEKFG